ncbi:MAG: hypothetical protein QOD04_6632 [Pseudonocardiales bacterium]|nr:hypothetical protein [Pseudonocardiales bacterium]
MTTPTEPRANGTDSAAERAAAPATRRRSHGTRFSDVAQGATSRVKGTAKKVSGATAARGKAAPESAAPVRPKVTAPTDVAAIAAETVGSTASKTVGSTARTASKTVGSTARTATKTVGSTARTATKTVGSTVRGAARTVGPVLAGGVGVGFGLLVARAMLLLELIKRIALQVIEALRDLARRLRERSGTDRSTNPSTEADGHSTEPVPM